MLSIWLQVRTGRQQYVLEAFSKGSVILVTNILPKLNLRNPPLPAFASRLPFILCSDGE